MSRRRLLALRIACFATLAALGLMVWGILHPVPLAVIAAMSVGQALGTLGFLLFCAVAIQDIKPIFRKRTPSVPPPSSKPPEPGDVESSRS